MIPRVVTAWTALVHDRYSGEMVQFLRDNPYGLNLDDLAEMTVNEIFYSGTFRHLAAGDRRSEPGRLWTTDAELISLEQAQAPHQAETLLPVRDYGTANALALWFSAELAPGVSLSVGPGDPPTHWGMTTAPLRRPAQLRPGMAVRAKVRTTQPGRPGHGRVGPSRCRTLAGRSTTSRLPGSRSTGQSETLRRRAGARADLPSSRGPGRWVIGACLRSRATGHTPVAGGVGAGCGDARRSFDEAERDDQQDGDHDGHHGGWGPRRRRSPPLLNRSGRWRPSFACGAERAGKAEVTRYRRAAARGGAGKWPGGDASGPPGPGLTGRTGPTRPHGPAAQPRVTCRRWP